MKRLNLIALLALTATATHAQIPDPGDPVCAYCEVNLKTATSHKRGCPYYEEPKEESSSSVSSSSNSSTSKPSGPTRYNPFANGTCPECGAKVELMGQLNRHRSNCRLGDAYREYYRLVRVSMYGKKKKEREEAWRKSNIAWERAGDIAEQAIKRKNSGANTPRYSTHLRDYTPQQEHQSDYNWLEEYYSIPAAKREMYEAHLEQIKGDYRVCSVSGKGMGVWKESGDGTVWHYPPHYERIWMIDGSRATMQLKTTKKWGVEDVEYKETIIDYEYDEVKYYPGLSSLFLNQRDEYSRNHWRLFSGQGVWETYEGFDFDFQDVILKDSPYRAYCQLQDGRWLILNNVDKMSEDPLAITISRVVNSVEDHKVYLDGHYQECLIVSEPNEEGKVQFGLMTTDGELFSDCNYDRIEKMGPLANYVKVWKDGKLGVLELVARRDNDDGKTYYGFIETIAPKYDMFKTQHVRIAKDPDTYTYCVVGNAGKYALTLADVDKPVTLPTIYTAAEVEQFATRLFTEGKKRTPVREDVDTDYKTFCENRAINVLQRLNTATDKDKAVYQAHQDLKEEKLMEDYLVMQRELHRKDYHLGKYDKARQAYEVKTAWGTVMMPVPQSEAASVKKAWKASVQDMTIKPAIQLDPVTNRPIISDIKALVNGKVYGLKEDW